MKLLPFFFVLIAFAANGQGTKSAFVTVKFRDGLQVDLPRGWSYMDKHIADHMNTSVEAIGSYVGRFIAQGDNEILVAANARDLLGRLTQIGKRHDLTLPRSTLLRSTDPRSARHLPKIGRNT